MPSLLQVPERKDIPVEQTWNAESVFESFDAWRAEYQAVGKTGSCYQKSQTRGHYRYYRQVCRSDRVLQESA